MTKQKKFGPWTVQEPLRGRGRSCYLVRKDGGELHVLKPAISKCPINNEVQALKLLTDHPNIITLVDYDLEAETPWHVTEYCSGGDFDRVRVKGWELEELSKNSIQEKLNDVAQAIGYAHSQGVLLGGFELWLNEAKDLIIGDVEYANVWESHHVDTTCDFEMFAYLCRRVIQAARRGRRRKLDAIRSKR